MTNSPVHFHSRIQFKSPEEEDEDDDGGGEEIEEAAMQIKLQELFRGF